MLCNESQSIFDRKDGKYVDRIEVCSMGEYRICRVLGIAPEKLLISGVLKQKEDILEILEECGGTCAYTVESLNQFTAWQTGAKKDVK